MRTPGFYSNIICLGTKIKVGAENGNDKFYSHIICLGTKITQATINNALSFTVT